MSLFMVQKKNAKGKRPAAKRKTVYGNGKKSRRFSEDGIGGLELRLMELETFEWVGLEKKNLYFFGGGVK